MEDLNSRDSPSQMLPLESNLTKLRVGEHRSMHRESMVFGPLRELAVINALVLSNEIGERYTMSFLQIPSFSRIPRRERHIRRRKAQIVICSITTR